MNKALFGVCGGIADFFGISATAIRLIFIFTLPISFWVYLILNFAVKQEMTLR